MTHDGHRARLIRLFHAAVFGPVGIPADIDQEMLVDLFRRWVTEQHDQGSPGFRHLLELVVSECEGELSLDQHGRFAGELTGGRMERSWRHRGQLAPERIADTD